MMGLSFPVFFFDDFLRLFRVRLVGGVEKWEDRKDFNFPHFCLVESEKVEGWKK